MPTFNRGGRRRQGGRDRGPTGGRGGDQKIRGAETGGGGRRQGVGVGDRRGGGGDRRGGGVEKPTYLRSPLYPPLDGGAAGSG